MKGIHCYFTAPIQQGRHSSGIYKAANELLPGYNLGIMVLSALQWKKTNGPIKLYCDEPLYELLEELGVLGCWDDIDCSLPQKDIPDIDTSVFWSASKFLSYRKENEPFACIDTDLIVWHKLPVQPQFDWQCAYWEDIHPGDRNSYPPVGAVRMPLGFIAPMQLDPLAMASNMCISLFNNMEFCHLFVDQALEFMKNNPAQSDDHSYALPEILFMEQRLPLMLSQKYNYSVKAFCECIWSPYLDRFVKQDERWGKWVFHELNPDYLMTHLWFHKKFLETHPAEKQKYTDKLIAILQEHHPAILKDSLLAGYIRSEYQVGGFPKPVELDLENNDGDQKNPTDYYNDDFDDDDDYDYPSYSSSSESDDWRWRIIMDNPFHV